MDDIITKDKEIGNTIYEEQICEICFNLVQGDVADSTGGFCEQCYDNICKGHICLDED